MITMMILIEDLDHDHDECEVDYNHDHDYEDSYRPGPKPHLLASIQSGLQPHLKLYLTKRCI